MRKYRVFVVEDDEDDWEFLKQAFEEVGCASELVHFISSDQLINELDSLPESKHPHLLILDHQTPGMSGSNVVTWIRSNNTFGSISLVVYSTVITAAMNERLVPQGVNLCLPKGNTMQEVKRDVLKFCEIAENKQKL